MLTQLDKNKKKMATDNFILCGCQSELKKKKNYHSERILKFIMLSFVSKTLRSVHSLQEKQST